MALYSVDLPYMREFREVCDANTVFTNVYDVNPDSAMPFRIRCVGGAYSSSRLDNRAWSFLQSHNTLWILHLT
jgi:hypothetical protein